MTDFRFKREERLKSRKVIGDLFKRGGQSIGKYPLLLVWKEAEELKSEFPVQFALSVSKRKFKNAVDRNFLRRRIREAYRLNKHTLYTGLEGEKKQFAFMVIYTGKEMSDYAIIEKSMQRIIKRFLQDWKPTK